MQVSRIGNLNYNFRAATYNNKTNPIAAKENPKDNNKPDEKNDDTVFTKKNALIAAGVLAAIFLLTKKGKKVQEGKGGGSADSTPPPSGGTQPSTPSGGTQPSTPSGGASSGSAKINPSKSNSFDGSIIKDNLPYEVKPPVISIKPSGNESDNTHFYQNIRENIKKDAQTEKRFTEVQAQINEDIKSIDDKLRENGVIVDGFGYGAHELSICGKRYFSMPDAPKKAGQSCLDPLLYQKPREEIVDLNLGYFLLAPMRDVKTETSKPLQELIDKFKPNEEETKFINDCINKMKQENAVNHGKNSVIDSVQHQKLGRIFREKLGIQVR